MALSRFLAPACPRLRPAAFQARCGHRCSRFLARSGVAFLLALSLAVAFPGARPLLAAGWSIKEVVIKARVLSNGSMAVTETRTFVFPEEFRWVGQWIPLQGCRDIGDIAVSEGDRDYAEVDRWAKDPATFHVVRTQDEVTVLIGYEQRAGERTLSLSYRVIDPVVVHNDVAELCWKFVGEDWEVGSRRVTVFIDLPAGAAPEEIRAWAHGPLQGRISITDSPTPGSSRVILEAENVPAGSFVEARVVFPVGLVPFSTNHSGRKALPLILAEEGRWAREANLRRALLRADAIAGPLLLLSALALAAWVLVRFGREFPPEHAPTYYRELPADYSPAELGVLWNWGSPEPADFTATLLDLARRGWILIEEVRRENSRPFGLGAARAPDYRVWRREAPPAGDALRPHEKSLIGFVFGEGVRRRSGSARRRAGGSEEAGRPPGAAGEPVLFSDIKSYARSNPSGMQLFFKTWQKQVQELAGPRGFFDEESARGRLLTAVGGVLLLAVGVGSMFLSLFVTGTGAMVSAAGLLVVTPFARRRSRYGSSQHALWRAFRRFLRHFSQLDRAELPALALWDHYLVYAVSLGVAKEVIRQLPLAYPEEDVARTLGRGWFIASRSGALAAGPAGVPVHAGLTRGLENLASFTSALTTSFQGSFSSGTGRGGGFSGGGGHGGGGGGGRAGG